MTKHGSMWRVAAVVGAAVIAVQAVGWFADSAAQAKGKPTIKDVMKSGYKGKECLRAKILDGSATPEQKKEFIALTEAMVGTEPPKGEKAAWDAKVETLVKATHAYLDGPGDEKAAAAFKAASDCKSCHSAHKGS